MKLKPFKNPYLDFQKLKAALGEDSHQRRSIGLLIKRGEITRVKKGLYLWGEKSNQPYSKEVVSNLIYGPSYVSLEYALFFYGLIPEKVTVITGISLKKKKEFETPVGLFTYEHLNSKAYPWGITLVEFDQGINAMIATPEKALLDTISLRIKSNVEAIDFKNILFADLRIETELYNKLDKKKMIELSDYYQNKSIKAFAQYLKLRD